MASAANPTNKKEVLRNSNAPNQFFRRERSFVVQRPSQPAAGNHFQQRERSFIRDGSRSINNSSYHSFNSSNKTNQARAQQSIGAATRGKPNMEIYRPPSLRSGETPPVLSVGGGSISNLGNRVQFQSKEDGKQRTTPRLTKSRTSLEMHSNSARGMKAAQQQQGTTTVAAAAAAVAATARPLQSPSGRIAMEHGVPSNSQYVLQRSKSGGGSNGLLQKNEKSNSTEKSAISAELPDLSHFPEHTQNLLRKIATDPDGAASRLVMEAVRKIFSRLIESSRYASPIARYCSYVIEKETKETFLESLLNTCQESFQERDRLLRTSDSSQSWVAFINFLNEMYIQLKRISSTNRDKLRSSRSPELIVLALLAESCCVTLKEPSSQALQELECLFFVLTGIGRDVENELPNKMVSIFSSIRDAFLDMNSLTGAAQRTLLQLIELRAAKWQLPATAVTYYYPSSVSNSAF